MHDINRQHNHREAHPTQARKQGIPVIGVGGPVGSGKTALLETTIAALKNEFGIAVIEGDLETENDAERIRAQGALPRARSRCPSPLLK